MAESIVIDADEAYEAQESAEVVKDASDAEGVSAGAADASAVGEQDKEDEVEIETESEASSVETPNNEIGQLKTTIRELQDQLLQMSARVREPAEAVKPKVEEEQLTRAQLAQIISENSDKPEVLLNVIDYMTEQKTRAVKKQAFEELSHSNWEREIAGVANRILTEDRDGYLAANPDAMKKAIQIAKNLRLEGHPAGVAAAYSLVRLIESLSGKEEKVVVPSVKKVSSSKMDKTRSLAESKRGSNKKLTKEHLEMAKRLGVKDVNLMARFIP